MPQREGSLDQAPTGVPLLIVRLDESDLSLKLMEMGCLPGEKLEIVHRASGGDPLAIKVMEYVLGLRSREAAAVWVSWGDTPLRNLWKSQEP